MKNQKSNSSKKPKKIISLSSKKKKENEKKVLKKDYSTRKKEQEMNNRPIPPKRLLKCAVFVLVLLVCLTVRIGFLQFVQGSELKAAATRSQTTNRVISPKRGSIYDATGKVLATSAQVDTVTINPKLIKTDNKEKVAKVFSDIFALDYEETLQKVNSEKEVETIIRKVEKEQIDSLKSWMSENNASSGINIDEDSKRYYPYGSLASNLIGFCDTDNQGLEGLELYWDSVLTGTPGKITGSQDAVSEFIPDENETYIAAENGSDITLSIDANIQTIVEKYLKQACIENDCGNGGTAIIMRPSTGDILAMATYPDYDLNNPRSAPSSFDVTTWNAMSSTDQLNELYQVWRNKAVSNTYEPGSTFKIITASVGIEENLVSTDTSGDFICNGYEMVSGTKINCWKNVTTHGSQTLRQALMNSCNPALMQLGQRIGAETLYKYYEAFGLFSKTGIATAGEVNSNFWDLDDVGPVELATMSFGQRFTITPLQLITAVSSIANDGILMQPRIVTKVTNTDNNTVTNIEPTKVRQVLSTDTCDKIIDMLESVVTDGTGRYGQVAGYSVAGKTGTSEPNPAHPEDGYVASFIGISPVENPEVVVLVTLYNPQGESNQGGQIAGPVVSQILSEVLPYLGVASDDLSQSDASDSLTTTVLQDVRNKTVAEAKKILEDAGFTCNFSGTDTSQIVTDQVPKPGTSLLEDATVQLYTATNNARVSQTVPDLKGMSYARAKNALAAKNLNIHVSGSGTVLSQDPMAGTAVEEGTVINVTLQKEIQDAH